PRPLLAERRAARALRRPPPTRGAPRLREGRQVVPHLVRHRPHHADGRAHLDLLRAGGSPPLHRDPGDLLHRHHLAPHAGALDPHGRDRPDPRAARPPGRRSLLVLLLRARPGRLVRGGRIDHGRLHPDRLHLDPQSPHVIYESGASVVRDVRHHGLPHAIATLTTGVAFCVLAYSGIESVIQTAGLVESWRDISKAYWFLALTVGIVTPLISA